MLNVSPNAARAINVCVRMIVPMLPRHVGNAIKEMVRVVGLGDVHSIASHLSTRAIQQWVKHIEDFEPDGPLPPTAEIPGLRGRWLECGQTGRWFVRAACTGVHVSVHFIPE